MNYLYIYGIFNFNHQPNWDIIDIMKWLRNDWEMMKPIIVGLTIQNLCVCVCVFLFWEGQLAYVYRYTVCLTNIHVPLSCRDTLELFDNYGYLMGISWGENRDMTVDLLFVYFWWVIELLNQVHGFNQQQWCRHMKLYDMIN